MKKKGTVWLVILVVAVVGYFAYQSFSPKSVDDMIYAAYGKSGDAGNGVMKLENVNPDYSRTIWYLTFKSDAQSPTAQVGSNLFSIPRVKRLFSAKDAESFMICYCYRLEGGGHDKILMATIDRNQYEKIIADSSYNSDYFYRYVTLVDADKSLFPDLQQYIIE